MGGVDDGDPIDAEAQELSALLIDGTASAGSIYMNVAGLNANISGAATVALTGTITVLWENAGTY